MNFFKRIILSVYTAYGVFVFFVFVLTAFPYAVFLTYCMPRKANNLFLDYCKFWSKLWVWSVGSSYKLTNYHYYDEKQNYVIISNHASTLDMFTGAISAKRNLKALAKIELKRIPMLGKMFAMVSVFIDRKSPESREAGRRICTQTLQNGYSILLFPEGSRNRSNEPLKPFYDGAFRMAIDAQKPILAYCVIGVRSMMSMDAFLLKPGRMEFIFLPPYSTEGLTLKDLDALKQKVFEDMKKVILEKDEYYKTKSTQ
jgi:1-acyl-sn-glycerol-3-phosphate acyltransferase